MTTGVRRGAREQEAQDSTGLGEADALPSEGTHCVFEVWTCFLTLSCLRICVGDRVPFHFETPRPDIQVLGSLAAKVQQGLFSAWPSHPPAPCRESQPSATRSWDSGKFISVVAVVTAATSRGPWQQFPE